MEFEWYTNGEKNIKVQKNIEPPSGYFKGFQLKPETKSRKKTEKNIKELNKKKLKAMPLSERRIVREKSKLSQELARKEKELCSHFNFEAIIESITRNLYAVSDVEKIYSIYHFAQYSDEFILNSLLKDIILEKVLIYQIEQFPKYFDTISDNLKALYSENHFLVNKKNIDDYFTSGIRSSPEAIEKFYGTQFLALL